MNGKQGLKKMFPHFDESKIGESALFRFKNAQHIVDRNYESKRPEHATPLKGLFLANFSQIYPDDRGTNFAVRDGEHLADMISSSLHWHEQHPQ